MTGSRVLCLSDGQLLLVEHRDPHSGERYWVLPGGGREAGETLAEAAKREVREETGVDVRVVRRLRVPATQPHVTYALFLAEPVAHTPAAPVVDIGAEVYLRGAAWVPVSEDDPIGPLSPDFWGYLGPRIRRTLRADSGRVGRGRDIPTDDPARVPGGQQRRAAVRHAEPEPWRRLGDRRGIMPWRFGDHVLLRTRNRGRVSLVGTATVVEDSPDLIALYVTMGSPTKVKVGRDGTPIPRSLPYRERFGRPWTLADGVWDRTSVLWLAKPDRPYMVGVFWAGDERRYAGMYGNLQDPLARHGLGFDTVDHVLDVRFSPDGSWSWKDEDEFADAQAVGRITPDEAARIRRVGEQVVAAWEAREWPFDRDWATWEPDPAWGVPPMPPNWDE